MYLSFQLAKLVVSKANVNGATGSLAYMGLQQAR